MCRGSGDNCRLAQLHVALAKNLLQCASLDVGLSTERSPVLEDHRRLFWSIFTLDRVFGIQVRVPSTLDSLDSPRQSTLGRNLRTTSIPCPTFPLEPHDRYGVNGAGIWAYMVQMVEVWGSTRQYLWSCANGQNKSPWLPDSEYTVINSHLHDLESVMQPFIRLESSQFPQRPQEEVQTEKDFWICWMHIQVTYHTVHALINHPFIYSQKTSQHRRGSNIFWKNSIEAAALHSTWVTKLIGMAVEKGLELFDPIFTHAAAVAATLHFYFSYATDRRISEGATQNLNVCKAFAVQNQNRVPLCRSIVRLSFPLLETEVTDREQCPDRPTCWNSSSL